MHRNKEVIKIFTDARRQLAEALANAALESQEKIINIFRAYLHELGDKEKIKDTTAVQAMAVIKNLIETFCKIDDLSPSEVNREAQERLINCISDAMRGSDKDPANAQAS
ncbi:MAG: hypothetical protein LBU51_05025 [Bacteroidales bacterium]|nr:hypothetical protein [Bacteroidales bacterium]